MVWSVLCGECEVECVDCVWCGVCEVWSVRCGVIAKCSVVMEYLSIRQ